MIQTDSTLGNVSDGIEHHGPFHTDGQLHQGGPHVPLGKNRTCWHQQSAGASRLHPNTLENGGCGNGGFLRKGHDQPIFSHSQERDHSEHANPFYQSSLQSAFRTKEALWFGLSDAQRGALMLHAALWQPTVFCFKYLDILIHVVYSLSNPTIPCGCSHTTSFAPNQDVFQRSWYSWRSSLTQDYRSLSFERSDKWSDLDDLRLTFWLLLLLLFKRLVFVQWSVQVHVNCAWFSCRCV